MEKERTRRQKSAHAIEVGQKIKAAREAAGLTQGQLAIQLGVTGKMVSHYEQGESELPLRSVQKLAEATGAEVGDFVLESSDAADNPSARREKLAEHIAFGLRLKQQRTQKGLTQDEVGSWFGLTNKAISQYEAGGAEFPSRYLPTLAAQLGVTIGYFFEAPDAVSVDLGPEDQDWLSYLGRRLATVPAGTPREQFRERMKEFADHHAEVIIRNFLEGRSL